MKKNDKIFTFSLLIVVLLVNLPNFIYYSIYGLYNHLVLSYIINLCLISIPLIILFKTLKVYFYLLLVIISVIPPAVLSIIIAKSQLNSNIILLMFESSYNDQLSYFGWLVYPFIILYLLLLLVLRWIIQKISIISITFKLSLSLSVVSIILLVAISSGLKYSVYKIPNVTMIYFPTNLIDQIKNVFKYFEISNEYDTITQDFSFNAAKQDTTNEREVYIFILGEAARYDRWHINGYYRNTSPNLSELNNILSYNQVSATGCNTSLSAPIILTRAETNSWDLHFREKSFIKAFSEAGFKTYWISSVAARGTHSIDIHAIDADEVVYLERNFNSGHGNYDFEITQKLEQLLYEDTSKKLFIVLHGIGSHWRYDSCYPNHFNRFKPSTTNIKASQFSKSHFLELNNSYDNSILYTDYFIGSTIDLIDKMNISSFVFYVSDHGENLLIDNNGYVSHAQPTEETLHVPLFIWTSNKYNYLYRSKVKTLKDNIDTKISVVNVFHTIIDMAHISYPEEIKSKSFASTKFVELDRFFLVNNFDTPLNINTVY